MGHYTHLKSISDNLHLLGGAKEEKSGIPQCLASNYIINSMLIRDLAFGMGFLGVNADLLSPSPLLYVNCQSYVNSSNLACCRFLTVMGHVSFPKDLREQLLCLFVRSETLNGRLPLDSSSTSSMHFNTVYLNIDLKGSIYVTT